VAGEDVRDHPVDRLFYVVRAFERLFRDPDTGIGLSLAQFHALAILADEEPLPAMNVAHRLQLAGPTASRIIEALERKGFVVKDRDPQDRRLIWLHLTDAGRSARERQHGILEAWFRDLADAIDPAVQEAGIRWLARLADTLQSRE